MPDSSLQNLRFCSATQDAPPQEVLPPPGPRRDWRRQIGCSSWSRFRRRSGWCVALRDGYSGRRAGHEEGRPLPARSGHTISWKIAVLVTGFKVQPPSVRRSGDVFQPVRNRAESLKAELDARGLVNWHTGCFVVTSSAAKHKASIYCYNTIYGCRPGRPR